MLRDEIKPFTDVNGYVNPALVDTALGRQCDNNMFTSEYYIMLSKLGQIIPQDLLRWSYLLTTCFYDTETDSIPGLLFRYPEGVGDQEGPDDNYALLAASKILNIPYLAQQFLSYGYRHLGFYNTEIPGSFKGSDGTINWSALQWRQPQMYFAAICAGGYHKWWKFWNYPVILISALTIIFSSHGSDTVGDLDSRRLTYLLILSTEQDSWICALAASLWKKRLLEDYGQTGMREVYKRYTRDNHPFGIYGQVY